MKGFKLLRLTRLLLIGAMFFLLEVPVSWALPPPPGPPNVTGSCTFVGTCSGSPIVCTCTGTLGGVTRESVSILSTENDKRVAECSGDLAAPSRPPHAVVCDGEDAGAPLCTATFNLGGAPTIVTTDDWVETISPRGEVALRCHFTLP